MRYLLGECGFRLRHEAILRYWELRGKPIYFHFITHCFGEDLFYYADEPFPEGFDINNPTNEHSDWADKHVWEPHSIDRTDPMLHQVAEELPKLVAMGHHKFVEVPDDVDAVIMANDFGGEWVAERHRTWS